MFPHLGRESASARHSVSGLVALFFCFCSYNNPSCFKDSSVSRRQTLFVFANEESKGGGELHALLPALLQTSQTGSASDKVR